MKKFIPFVLLITGLFVISSCKKNDKDEPTPNLDAQVQQHNNDANTYKSESDQMDDEINNYISQNTTFGARYGEGGGHPLINSLCGVTIDSSEVANKILYFNFDGITPCLSPSRTRGGQIKVQLKSGNKWADIGAVLTITYNNFKITRLKDNKSIMFNGVKTLQNINGNDWFKFLTSGFILKYKERALNIAVSFDNGLSATWNSARITEWTFKNKTAVSGIPYDHINFKATGDTTVGGFSTVDSWGVNRFGKSFTTYYNSSVISNTYCGFWRFTGGELVHNINSNNYVVTLGVDQNGNPTPYVCAYGYRVTWKGANGNSVTRVCSY
jgi:hypothetical protein